MRRVRCSRGSPPQAPARQGTTLAEHPEVSGNIVAWSKLSRVELWRAHGLRFPEDRLYEDQIVAQRLYVHARAIDVIPDVVVQWRERADGSSITQRKDALPVLADYLDALRGGIAVLDAAGQRAAARARIRLILDMDTPPLVRIAQQPTMPTAVRSAHSFVSCPLARNTSRCRWMPQAPTCARPPPCGEIRPDERDAG
jgi:hypothetical protein